MTDRAAPPILFVENREKTRFWAAVASELIARGIRVEWIVQNPLFVPRDAGPVHVLPFPGRRDRSDDSVSLNDYPAVVTDRGRQYFNAGCSHYPFYRDRITKLMREIAPALVVGESTLIQELFAIEAAEKVGAVFVHPAAGRYPLDRFFLFVGESQKPLIGSGDDADAAGKRELALGIAQGTQQPAYMKRHGALIRYRRKLKWAFTRWRIWYARLIGERYNTPSFNRKIALAMRTMRNARQWDRLAATPKPGQRAILYPLQLQPEASIDVWGRPYSDQPALIRALLTAAPDDVVVAVKANPKLKYETSDALLAMAKAEPRILLLPRDMSMAAAHEKTIGAVTVCGTVGLEAIFGRGRCISLRHPIIDDLFPEASAATPEEAVDKLLNAPDAGRGSPEKGERMLYELGRQSFPGLVCDPLSMPECLDPANVALVANGIEKGWLQTIAQRDRQRSAA